MLGVVARHVSVAVPLVEAVGVPSPVTGGHLEKRAAHLLGDLRDPRATRGFRSVGLLEKRIGADRATTERLLVAIGARKSDAAEEWTLTPITG